MALHLRPRAIPQCSACIRSYAWMGLTDVDSISPIARQQVRGKKKLAKTTGLTTVRLLKHMNGFGKKGAIVPVTTGEMRNKFFPQRLADYVTGPELRTLRASNVTVERDYEFTRASLVPISPPREVKQRRVIQPVMEAHRIVKVKPQEPEILTPTRSTELLEIFINPVLEFYRQPIIKEKEEEPRRQPSASSAAADLLAARLQSMKAAVPQAIYGSVTPQDVLVHIRAALATHGEAARVVLTENDIYFKDVNIGEEARLKHVGDFGVEIRIKGSDESVYRTVRVVPQEA